MSKTSRTKRIMRRVTDAIRASEPTGPIHCSAESVNVEPAIEAAEGRAARRPSFNILAYTGGLLRVGWSRPLVVDLAGLRAGRTTILLDHDSSQIVGQGQATLADGQITVQGEITGDLESGSPASQVVSHAKNGFVWAASIGVSPERVEPVDANQTVTVNGKDFSGPIYVVRAGRLGETSFVGVGADENATASIAAKKGEAMTFDQWLQAKGVDKSKINGTEYETLFAQYQSEGHKSEPHASQTPAMQSAAITASGTQTSSPSSTQRIDDVIAEGHRRRALENMVMAHLQQAIDDPAYTERIRDLYARAIDAKTSVRDFEMELLRATVAMPPTIRGNFERELPPANASVIEAACMLGLGHKEDGLLKTYGERTLDAANKQFGTDFGLQEAVLRCANANGYSGRQRVTTSNWRDVMSYAIPQSGPGVKAAFSTISLANVLGAVANKAMAAEADDPTYLVPRLFGSANHANFHAHTVCSLAANGELATVTPTGELDHLNLGEETYTRQVGTKGAVLRLSRQNIINDDMGAFDRMARLLARKAYTTREKVGFTLIMASGAGSTHFTAAHGNYVTGATSAFGTDGMAGAIQAFRNLTGPDGDPIMVEPEIVLVPPTLEWSGRTLLAPNAPLIVTGLSATNARGLSGATNIYGGRFGSAPLVSPYLENAAITGYSTAYWYMFANPSRLPCYEIAYLNGQQAPTVEYFGLEAEADTLGVAWRVYWDFGVAAAEWRAGVKSAGS